MSDTTSHEPQNDNEKDIHNDVDPISQNIESLVDLHIEMERKIHPHQRAIERFTAFLGRPRFLYIILSCVALWIVLDTVGVHFGWPRIDPPPFYWLQGIIGLSALLMTTIVLITQNRQTKATEQRRRLDLQVNLVVEQKVTKLITLIEELRRDMPGVEHRHDPEVKALQETVDPQEVLARLNEMLKTGALKNE